MSLVSQYHAGDQEPSLPHLQIPHGAQAVQLVHLHYSSSHFQGAVSTEGCGPQRDEHFPWAHPCELLPHPLTALSHIQTLRVSLEANDTHMDSTYAENVCSCWGCQSQMFSWWSSLAQDELVWSGIHRRLPAEKLCSILKKMVVSHWTLNRGPEQAEQNRDKQWFGKAEVTDW